MADVLDRALLYKKGRLLLSEFCKKNALFEPRVNLKQERWRLSACAYFRPATGITICLPACAAVGLAGRSWSYPGYVVDRTPYGVLQHELGHAVDYLQGSRRQTYSSEFSTQIRSTSNEPPLTSYCPDDAEWFAEMFRLFVTNPDLLKQLRPTTFMLLRNRFLPVFTDDWKSRLALAPERTLKAATNRVAKGR